MGVALVDLDDDAWPAEHSLRRPLDPRQGQVDGVHEDGLVVDPGVPGHLQLSFDGADHISITPSLEGRQEQPDVLDGLEVRPRLDVDPPPAP